MKNKRLLELLKLINEKSLIDIGTDHAYLLIEAVKTAIIEKGLAVEISDGPLINAQENIKKKLVQNQIDTVKSDGLKEVEKNIIDEYQAVSICGMGGVLIGAIIEDSCDKFKDKTLYLQPNNKEYELREKLLKLNFEIINEKLVLDNKIIYEIIVCKYTEYKISLTEKEKHFGKFNLELKSALFLQKYQEERQHLTKMLEQINCENKEATKVYKKLKIIEEVLCN